MLMLRMTAAFAVTRAAYVPRAVAMARAVRRLAAATGGDGLPNDDAGWMTRLSPLQFAVLRNKATEPGGYSESTEGELEFELSKALGTKYPKQGTFECAGCGAPLYTATSKFDSGCGWPAFYEGLPGAIKELPDEDGRRVEIVCGACNGHLGHVFKSEGFPTPTDERHCVNGVSLKYAPRS